MRLRHLTPLLLIAVSCLPARADEDAKQKAGRALFQKAVAWIGNGQPAVTAIQSAHLRFEDVQFEDPENPDSHMEGFIDFWFDGEDKFRQEQRDSRRAKNPVRAKLLNGQRAWTYAGGKWRDERRSGGSAAAVVAQRKKDATQLIRLARFISPASLDAKGVTWTLEGDQALPVPLAPKGAPAFQRVKREAPGDNVMLFFFRQVPAKGTVPAAVYPAAIYIQGRTKADGGKERDEWFVLDRWKRPGTNRARPGRIQGFLPTKAKTLGRFALLFPGPFEINPKLPESVFLPPAKPAQPVRKTPR